MDDKILVSKEEYVKLKNAFDQLSEERHLSQPAIGDEPQSSEKNISETEKRYHTVFENSPISIWEEDFSAVKALFDDLRKDGIVDIESYFSQYPEIICKCADLVKIVDINKAALTLHAAANKEELLAGLSGTFTSDSFEAFRQELVSLWNGCLEMSVETTIKTFRGIVRNVTVCYSVCHGCEVSLSKVLVSLTDITERKRNEAINASRLHLIQFAAVHTVAGLLEETLNEAEKLTDSRIGFYHFVENDQQTLSLQEWSTNTKAKFCKAEGKGMHYPICDAGVWVDCVKLGKTVIHNNYASLPHRKGLPEGHAEVLRELVVPVFRGEKIKAILGVGNKPVDYVEKDIETISLLADLAWEIAERKQAEEALQKSEEKYRTLIQKTRAAIIVHGADTQIEICNSTAQELLGLTEDQMLGKTSVDPAWHFRREDGTVMPFEEYPVNQVMTMQQPLRDLIIEIHRPTQGNNVWVLVNADPVFGKENEILEVIVTFVDITARKQAEQKTAQLAAIVESSDDVIIGKSLDGTVTSWNKGAEKIYGYTESEMVGNPITVLAVPGNEDDFRMILEKMKRGEHLDHFETVRRRKDGQYIHMSLTVSPVMDAEGRIIGSSTIGRDITERKLAEEALQISDSRYRVAQSIGQVGNWEYNLETTHFWDSDEAKRIFGFDPNQADFSTDEVEKCIPERERVHQALVDLIEKGKEYNLEFEIHPRNSSESRIISSVAVLHRDELGNPQVVKGVIQDITKRKQAEEALHRMNRELRAVSNCNQVLVRADDEQTLLDEICRIICEEAGYRFVWVGYAENDKAKTIRPVAMSGFDNGYLALARLTWADTPRGCGPAGVAIRSGNSVYSQDLATDPHFAIWRDNVLKRGYRSAIALPLKDENASVFGVMLIYSSEVNAFKPDEIRLIEELAGDLAFGITTLRTRAKRKQAEQQLSISENRLNQAQRIAHIGSWELNLVTGKLEWSDEIYRIFEIDPLQFGASYDAFLNCIHPDDREMVNRAYTQSLENKAAYDIVHRLKFPDGRIKFVHEHCITFYNEEGRPTSSLGTVQDITERKMVEDEVQKLNQELEQRVTERTAQLESANKELEAFAYSVSHDLRAPLRHVDGYVELLQNRTQAILDEQNKHYMNAISDAAKRMGTLIDDLLSFSRMGRQEMSKMQVNMNQLVSDVIQEFEPDVKDRTVTWQIADLPEVTGDRAMLKVVLVNLIANALKFTRTRQQAEIEIGCKHENKAETVFYISDNGIGFDPDYAGKLFGVFQRLHRADEFEGTGIGLANVRRIINRHGGRTWAEGKVEKGATFYFTIT